MYAILAAIISGISSTAGKKMDNTIATIQQEWQTSRSWIEAGKEVAIADWDVIGKGYMTNDILSYSIAQNAITKKELQRKAADNEEKFKKNLLIIGLAAAALVVLVIVIKK